MDSPDFGHLLRQKGDRHHAVGLEVGVGVLGELLRGDVLARLELADQRKA
jgi:hypothetical protein